MSASARIGRVGIATPYDDTITPSTGGAKSPKLMTSYREELQLTHSKRARLALALGVAIVVLAPYQLSDSTLQLLTICGCFAIGSIGLNLLTGYAGQISLGHAFFVAVGAYAAAALGDTAGLPMIVWLPAAALIGAGTGLLVGPFAMRLRGNYLAIVTLALLFFAEYLFTNWTSLTGGPPGIQPEIPIAIGPVDFAELDLIGYVSPRQGQFLLVMIVLAIAIVLATNLVRTRSGRAMQAVRDRDVAAEVCGVSLLRYKLGAFAISSAFAAVCGALYLGVVLHNVVPAEVSGMHGTSLSIIFVTIIIVGGLGTIWGAVVGALFVEGLPLLLSEHLQHIPVLSSVVGDDRFLTVTAFNNMLLGALIVVFLLAEPQGLAAIAQRTRRFLSTWPLPR